MAVRLQRGEKGSQFVAIAHSARSYTYLQTTQRNRARSSSGIALLTMLRGRSQLSE